MATILPIREMRAPDHPSGAPNSSGVNKAQRVLACVLCQQRKVKCDRKSPCGNCVKSRVQCVSASLLPRRRKRRFPERILLDRLRHYEELLRQNNIKFEPLHGDATLVDADGLDDETPKTMGTSSSTPSTPASFTRLYDNRSARHVVNEEDGKNQSDDNESEDEEEILVKRAWSQIVDTNDHLLFGFRKSTVQTSHLHPEPAQIFRLWQIYLDNVDPLLKVTHTSSLQSSIVEAVGNLSSIKPPLEALMFGIYSMAVFTLDAETCQSTFGSSKSDLISTYWLGCQQTLVNCGFLHTQDRDSLTALFLYLVSLRHSTLPQSLSSMLGVAIRIAQRMAIHSESALARCPPLEAEMRRRLWWSLVLFDSRIGELADSKSPTLTPMWDCRIPLNVNDSELRSTMKEPSNAEGRCTESLFAVVRGAMGNAIRHTMFNLFASPLSKYVARDLQQNPMPGIEDMDELEKTIEERYLRHCDLDEPLHYMTVWMTRASIAKCRILEHNFRFGNSASQQTDAEREQALKYAQRMLECDTKLTSSPLTKNYRWMVHFYFPMFAYTQSLQVIKRQPTIKHADGVWKAMSDNYDARFGFMCKEDAPFVYPFFKVFSDILFQAWDSLVATLEKSGQSIVEPRIVTVVREKVDQLAPNGMAPESVTDSTVATPADRFSPTAYEFGGRRLKGSAGGQDFLGGIGSMGQSVVPGLEGFGDFDQIDWSAMDWTVVSGPMDSSNMF